MNKLNLKNVFKRIGAYMIDIFVIISIASLVTNIKPFKTKYEEYLKNNAKYEENLKKYNDIINQLDTAYKDNKIDDKEYQELIENEDYKDLILSAYEDKQIDKNEYKKIVRNINNDYQKESMNLNYKLQKLGIFNSIITVVTTFLYFGVLEYFLKGQTLGKKILGIKVVSANEKKLNIVNYMVRCLIINNVFLNTINIIFLEYGSKATFLKASNVISILLSVFEAITIYLVISREDNRGLHDLICNTKVISVNESKEQ